MSLPIFETRAPPGPGAAMLHAQRGPSPPAPRQVLALPSTPCLDRQPQCCCYIWLEQQRLKALRHSEQTPQPCRFKDKLEPK
eukprot:CAMPEP_0204455394 /NCGR_PEP_ID=MMETSP0471-20130131/1077_1 /ASSEMBLY_ACC=CAM_ASM_000602 /TAXON_ID=2969 /ORGANISM="Oxyrrhis marina" /LENGTH=81 /DNA_ID=CAMNT_0051455433 /DNA_START=144 /DNA_END=386 /DNA_ORIENTATION=+